MCIHVCRVRALILQQLVFNPALTGWGQLTSSTSIQVTERTCHSELLNLHLTSSGSWSFTERGRMYTVSMATMPHFYPEMNTKVSFKTGTFSNGWPYTPLALPTYFSTNNIYETCIQMYRFTWGYTHVSNIHWWTHYSNKLHLYRGHNKGACSLICPPCQWHTKKFILALWEIPTLIRIYP